MKNQTVGYTETLNYKCLEDLQQTVSMGSMNPLNLSYCGKENCRPGWFFGPYARRNYLIHVVTSGKGIYRVSGQELPVSAGQAFMIHVRLERAAQLLRETDMLIGNVAFAVGYSDALSFSKAFRQKYHMSPSEYKASPPELTEVAERGGYSSPEL